MTKFFENNFQKYLHSKSIKVIKINSKNRNYFFLIIFCLETINEIFYIFSEKQFNKNNSNIY